MGSGVAVFIEDNPLVCEDEATLGDIVFLEDREVSLFHDCD